MAHVVVPKREPCVKCNNPVFLAERLLINQSLYHRTCFRCARCSSVLTLGNFYETEKDREYCCETCPDEEKTTSPKVEEANRLSIAQKIALFEKDSSNVLKKSLSDEEKSKSLSRQPTANSEALNSFLTAQINPPEPDVSEDEKTAESLSSESESEDDDPSTLSRPDIPTISDKKSISDHKIISEPSATKELTHGGDVAAIADTHPESHEVKDIASAHLALVESDKKAPESPNDDDEFELLFEKLAEDAVKTPNIPIFVPVVIPPTPEESPKEVPLSEVVVEPVTSEVDVPTSEVDVKASEIEIKTSEVEPESSEPKTEPSEVETKVESPEASTKVIQQSGNVEIIASDDSSLKPSSSELEPVDDSPKPEVGSDDALYPIDLNPFGDDEASKHEPLKRPTLNPFGSCSEDEDEDKKVASTGPRYSGTLPKPPRPPPPKTMTLKASSTNPFASDDEDDEPQKAIRTPVPTPRKPLLHSTTPEPSPRSISNHNSPGHSFKGSTSSLASSSDGMSLRRKKKKAPSPPVPPSTIKPDGTTNNSKTPSNTPRKKRPAPTPPTSTPKPSVAAPEFSPSLYITANDISASEIDPQSISEVNDASSDISQPLRRLIPLEECLIEEGSTVGQPEAENVTYRRRIVPLRSQSTTEENFENLEQTKDNKEAQNRQRQSEGSLMGTRAESESTDSLPYSLNKSSHGKWKRRKGPAPALPGYAQPQRRILQMLPLQDIRRELEVIEVQQQGLEKQGVMLEKMIRERCEGSGDNRTTEELLEALPSTKNPKEVEELILQLFELVNEKNELFRRQAELMYLRRAHRLEEEQADVEYEIRTLMAQPEQNKTDSDKTKEEALIARLVEIVQLRNEVVDTLDRDRLREAEEDLSIKQRMESHTAKLDQDYLNQTPTKLSKKEKKKLKEAKKLKNKKLDADKDLDTSEIKSETSEKKKKKKKLLF